MTIQFTKMTGAGNDFVLIDNRSKVYELEWSRVAVTLCDRRFGIGADGLLILEPSEGSSFRMLYYNADGSYGGMCGNGGRCVARFVLSQTGDRKVTFTALDHQYQASLGENGLISLQMKMPEAIRTEIPVTLPESELRVNFINTGSPHAVVFVDDMPAQFSSHLNSSGILGAGRAIRSHREFEPEGTNVDFVWKKEGSVIAMRTYERGVEDETLACGTGAVASALLASRRYGLESPIDVLTRSNKVLHVGFKKEANSFFDVQLIGPAEVVFTGIYWLEDLHTGEEP